MKHLALDGQVEFDMTYRTLRTEIVLSGFKIAFPEWDTWDKTEAMYVTWIVLAAGFGTTRNITYVGTGEPSPEIVGLLEFWELACNENDYAKVFRLYSERVTVAVNEAYWDAYSEATKPPAALLAPEVVQPGVDVDKLTERAKKKGTPISSTLTA